MAAQAVVFQDCRASGVNLKRNLIQTSLGRRQRGFYVLFCVFNVPWVGEWGQEESLDSILYQFHHLTLHAV